MNRIKKQFLQKESFDRTHYMILFPRLICIRRINKSILNMPDNTLLRAYCIEKSAGRGIRCNVEHFLFTSIDAEIQ